MLACLQGGRKEPCYATKVSMRLFLWLPLLFTCPGKKIYYTNTRCSRITISLYFIHYRRKDQKTLLTEPRNADLEMRTSFGLQELRANLNFCRQLTLSLKSLDRRRLMSLNFRQGN